MKNKGQNLQKALLVIRRYFLFFLLLCFIITCCMLLFLQTFSRETGIVLEKEQIEVAARLTFMNIILLSLLFTVIDYIRRKIWVDYPVKQIIAAAQRVMNGDFACRLKKFRGLHEEDGFNVIGSYFNQMIEELSHMETLRTDFIANVSHELKTPLAVIQNEATLLSQPDLSADRRVEYASTIREASKQLSMMVTNILKLNKLENQTFYPDTSVYDLGEQLCESLLGFENIWEEKNLDIQTQIQDAVYVRADPELLLLVWNNLFSNAIKFTDPGGTISLVLKTEGNQAVVQISDTGCGISPEVGKHIFEKFYQGDTSHATKGNGLGLALVKRVIDIIHGDIQVTSQVGKGSSFVVTIPQEQPDVI